MPCCVCCINSSHERSCAYLRLIILNKYQENKNNFKRSHDKILKKCTISYYDLVLHKYLLLNHQSI